MGHVVVVGAGMGSLACAVRLAAAGHQVTVCEAAPTVGGKAGWFERDGFGFDTGPSLVTLPAVYRDLFATTGPPLHEVVDLVPLPIACRYRFAGGTWLDVPSSRGAAAAAFERGLSAGAGEDWTRFMARAGDIWDLTRGPFLESALDGPRTLARLARSVSAVRTVAPWSSLRTLGRRYLRDPRLRVFLDRYATYSGSDPRKAPAALATVPYVEQAFGSWYVRGGIRQLVAATEQRARELGVTIRTDTPVRRIVVTGGRATGVEVGTEQGHTVAAERIDADVVVSGIDATQLYTDLVPGRIGAGARRSLRRATPSFSGFVILLALRDRTPDLEHHTVLFGEDYDVEFDALFGRRGHPAHPPTDPTVYISAPNDPELRPDEHHESWFVLVNAPRHDPAGGMDWDAAGLADDYADHILALMARRGVDVRDRVLWREVRTPADLARDTGSVGGSIYGTSSNGASSAFLRPANRSPVPGLFVVGGSAHPGGGLPLVGLSAAIVADLIGPGQVSRSTQA